MAEHHRVAEGHKVRSRPRRGRGDSAALDRKPRASDRTPPEATVFQEGTAGSLIALQQRVGNRAVQQLLNEQGLAQRALQSPEPLGAALPAGQLPGSGLHGSSLSIMRQALLSAGQETSAINFTNRHYDSRSVRIIQIVTGANVDGSFGGATAQAVAGFQQANPPLVVDGKVGENTLNVIVPNRVAAGSHEHAIQLVADFYNLDTTRDTLTVHFDAGLLAPFNTTFQSGNLRVIQIGSVALANATDLRDAIRDGLAIAAPAGPAPGPRPTHLTPAQEQAATAFNRATYTDRRSVLGIQGLVGTGFDARFGPDTAERVAEFQDSHALEVDGKVGQETLRAMVAELDAAGQQDAAIRMIIDFFNLSEHGALLDIAFDPTETANASTSGDIPGPSIVRIGPKAFAQGFEGLVHTIAHELEHVRQRRVGIPSQAVREFLGEAIEIMSVGMPEEDTAGFMDDAGRALHFWNAMAPADQLTNAARFQEVRDQVNNRFNNFTPAEQVTHQATVNAYNAVVVPVPAP